MAASWAAYWSLQAAAAFSPMAACNSPANPVHLAMAQPLAACQPLHALPRVAPVRDRSSPVTQATKLTFVPFWSSPSGNQRRLVDDEILKLRTHRARRRACTDRPVVYLLDVVCGMLAEGLDNALPPLLTCSHAFVAAGGACPRARGARIRDRVGAHALGQGPGRGVEAPGRQAPARCSGSFYGRFGCARDDGMVHATVCGRPAVPPLYPCRASQLSNRHHRARGMLLAASNGVSGRRCWTCGGRAAWPSGWMR